MSTAPPGVRSTGSDAVTGVLTRSGEPELMCTLCRIERAHPSPDRDRPGDYPNPGMGGTGTVAMPTDLKIARTAGPATTHLS